MSKLILAAFIILSFTKIKAQDLSIASYSFKQYITKNDGVKFYKDTIRIVINNDTFIKGSEHFKVITIQQSKLTPNKYRIYYLKPGKIDFEFDIDEAIFDERYNELKFTIGATTTYGLYID